MNPTAEHRLEGLEPTNFLAFVALLGLLRALETARPDWRPRVRWPLSGAPCRPHLALRANVNRSALAEAASDGLRVWGECFRAAGRLAIAPEIEAAETRLAEIERQKEFTKKLSDERKKLVNRIKRLRQDDAEYGLSALTRTDSGFREIAAFATNNRQLADTIACLSVQTSKGSEAIVLPTPLKFSSGQQAFLGCMIRLSTGPTTTEIEKALFETWAYNHRGDSFRLSPAEARWYALSERDPTSRELASEDADLTGEGIAPSELGANTLASLGLLSFPFIPARPPEVCGWGEQSGRDQLDWPIFVSEMHSVSLAGLEAALMHAQTLKRRGNLPELQWLTARVFLLNPGLPSSKYKNVSWAQLRNGDRGHWGTTPQ